MGNVLSDTKLRPALFLSAIYWAAVFGAMSMPCNADTANLPTQSVMIGSKDRSLETLEAAASIRADMSGRESSIRVELVDTMPPLGQTLELARQFAETYGADVVFWQQDQNLYFYVPRRTPNELIVRPLGQAEQENSGHTVGLIVSSMLDSLSLELVSDATAVEPKAATTAPPPRRDAPKTDVLKEPAPKTVVPGFPQKKRPRLFLSAGYAVDNISTRYPAVHGGRFGIAARLVADLHLTADYTVMQHLETKALSGGGSLTVKRRPVGLGLQWVFSPSRLRFGIGALVELDIATELPKANTPSIRSSGNETHVRVGLVPDFIAQIRIVGPLYAFLQIGLRILTIASRYEATRNGESESLYAPWRFQPRSSIGLCVSFF